jgi:hypothetical protein
VLRQVQHEAISIARAIGCTLWGRDLPYVPGELLFDPLCLAAVFTRIPEV